MKTYEDILHALEALGRSISNDEHNVEWLTHANVLGISRTPDARVEIFLAGFELRPKLAGVRRAIDFRTWHRSEGEGTVDANRLLLPAAGHFDQIAALICAELIRNGVDESLQEAFAKVEPLIEVAIAKLRLTDQAIVGLCGEILVLDSLLRNAPESNANELVESWLGWKAAPRDFAWLSVGIEVKTTTKPTSSHLVEGIHQVELRSDDAGALESALFLVSIGVEWTQESQDNTFTLPGIVDSILGRLRLSMGEASEPVIDAFLGHVRDYGDDQDVGYDHLLMSGNAVFARPFVARFVRSYDMADPNIHVIRSEDLNSRQHVVTDSLRFRINLPDRVSGDLNPISGLNASARKILRAGLGGE